MTTYVNTSAPDNNNSGTVIAIIVIAVLGFLFIYFGLPALRNMGTPQTDNSSPVINVPDEVDVNIQQTP